MKFFPLINLCGERSLIWHFSFLNLKLKYSGTYLGFLWAALEPLAYFILLYVVFTDYVISFWLTREIARGVDSARTALISSIMFSVGGTFSYLIIAYFVGFQVNIDYEILFFGAILIFPRIINDILHFLNFGWKPQVVSYALLGSEIVKVPAALVLVYFFNLRLFKVK